MKKKSIGRKTNTLLLPAIFALLAIISYATSYHTLSTTPLPAPKTAPVAVTSQYTAGVQAYKAKNFSKAAAEWQKAAAQGDVQAQYGLGNLYTNGQGVLKNDAKAVEWYRKAANQGYDGAQFALGLHYMNGAGVKKDMAEAYFWLALSADHEKSGPYRDQAAKSLTPQEIIAVKKRIAEWKPIPAKK
jgi:hypothetical protein